MLQLAHPILESLKGTEEEWVIDLLYAFNSGSLDKFEKLKPKWSLQPDLKSKALNLKQKICLLCLMEVLYDLKTFVQTSEAASNSNLLPCTHSQKEKLSISSEQSPDLKHRL